MMKIASGRVYTGDETFRPIKELMQISEKISGPTGSYWSLYKGLKREQGKGFATDCGKE